MSSSFKEIEKLKRLANDANSKGHSASVVELLRCYLTHFPDDGNAWFIYGDNLRELGLFGEAVVALGKAEKLSPIEYEWAVRARQGLLFHKKGDHQTAERWYAKALQSEEVCAESWAWVVRGANFAAQELLDEAEECHRKAIAINTNDEEAYLNLGYILRAKRQYTAAKYAAQKALELSPDYTEAIELLNGLDEAQKSREITESL